MNSGIFLPNGNSASFSQHIVSTIETIIKSRKLKIEKSDLLQAERRKELEKAYADKAESSDSGGFVYSNDSLDGFKEFLNRFYSPDISPENLEKIMDLIIFGSNN
jgi:hypothetical protein